MLIRSVPSINVDENKKLGVELDEGEITTLD